MAFLWVMKEVLGLPDDDLLFKILDANDISPSMPSILALTEDDVKALRYNDGTDVHEVSFQRRVQLKILREWNLYLQKVQGKRFVDWFDTQTVNDDEWDEFRVSIYNTPNSGYSGSVIPVHIAPASSGPSTTRPAPSAASEFRRGIKRDKSHYKNLKDEFQWNDWKRSTVSTVYAHGCENILSQSYVPSTADESVLFIEQQKFMYDVWVTILHTPMGKHFVRENEGTRDAQAVWRSYSNYMRTSTRADIQIEDLMTSLTSLRIDTHGNAQKFILGWLDKLRVYEELTPLSAHFPDNMKKAMLQNAISSLKVFRDVKTSEQMEVA